MSKEPRLTDLQRICNLNVVQAMAVQQYIERLMERPGTPTPARTTLICAAHMLDACAENMEKLSVGYGAEQMRGIAKGLREGTPTLEQATQDSPPSSPEKCVIGEYCRLHQFVHGAEAEELRERFEKLASDDRRNCKRSAVRRILDDVDARDSCAFVESAPSAPAAANGPKA